MSKYLTFIVCLALYGCHNYRSHHALISSYPGMTTVQQDKKIVLAGGVFDVIHYGHLKFFEAAKREGDYLIIALEPDSSIIKHKKRIPVHTQSQRADILSHIDYIDEIILLPEMKGYEDYLQLVLDVQPQVIAVTHGDTQRANKQRQAMKIGAEVIDVTPLHEGLSTSKILKHSCQN